MREKYIEEAYPRYFIFGEHSDGLVDVASTYGDVACRVTREDAERLIADRHAVVDRIIALAGLVEPATLTAFWYGRPE